MTAAGGCGAGSGCVGWWNNSATASVGAVYSVVPMHPGVTRPFRIAFLAAALPLGAPAGAQRVLPAAVAPFELPVASPRATGFAGRIIAVGKGDSRFGAGTEADVTLGENLPVLLLGSRRHPWLIGFNVSTQARFSLSDPKSALISNDWVVGFDVSGRVRRFDLAVQVYHESSHLGDEYAERFAARRLDWTREVVMAWVGMRVGQATIRAAGGSAVIDHLGLPRGLAAIAIDYRGRDGFIGHAPGRLLAGVYTEAAAATDWRVSTTARLGVELGALHGNRIAVGLVVHDGLSTQRQFYSAESRYAGVEVRFDL